MCFNLVKPPVHVNQLDALSPPWCVPGNNYRTGYNCPQAMAWWLEPWTCTLAGISLGFCVLIDPYIWFLTARLRTVLRQLNN